MGIADDLVNALFDHFAGQLALMTDPRESPNYGGLNFVYDDDAGWVFVVWPDLVAFHAEPLQDDLRAVAFEAIAKWGQTVIARLTDGFEYDDAIIAAGDTLSDQELALCQFLFDEDENS